MILCFQYCFSFFFFDMNYIPTDLEAPLI
uniref:Uncharacterized protein n=1 Tax=Arundo donax TaxID=35708 RepID=A0A0A9F7S8_ARUDO